ncbi:alpha/beta fold hydrolase [Oricola sp.]|uniref:alpha/beta fold hydrolase n=1 Tax=Oricola sp. TaxID=1979950 RepID=UPI0025EACF1F|nr:alpha/beta fold hydrolase [Oricola sp.]MCI5074522.1 alpha/beta fold hydrolase [Oricola sp.]
MGKTHRIRTPQGHELAVSRRDGSGLPVMFLNSFAADHTMWDAVRDRLDRLTIAYDAQGHGASDIPAAPLTLDELAADARAVMDAEGLETAVLCGLSLGGLTAVQLAEEAPDRVAGLALANTAVNFPPPGLWRDRAEAARAGDYAGLVSPTLERWLTKGWRDTHPHETAQVRTMLEAMSPEGYAAACHALETGDVSTALAAWPGPTLVIAGEHDQSSPVARSEEMVRLASGADLVVLDAAHVSAIEAPDAFAQALEAFVAKCEAQHG